jgi:predicted HTH domain antitoxin
MLQSVVREVPFFKRADEKQKFLEVMGALSLRLISLAKASEIMGMDTDRFLTLLDNYGYEFSFLDNTDIEIERNNP